MRKIAVVTTLFVVALFALPLGAAATGGGSDSSPAAATCPLPTGQGAYVVDIGTERLLAWDSAKSTAGPAAFSLPAGSYDVYLTSYDDHSNKTHQSQLEEQWYLQGLAGASVVFTTAATPDLPETTDLQSFMVGSITTGQAIDHVLAVHAAYPDQFEPHSVAPLCAGFYPTGTGPIPSPHCPFPQSPYVASITTELLLAWDAARSMAGPVDFSLPAGTWDVWAVSYDNHSDKSHQVQLQEKWYLEGRAGTSAIFTTPSTPDLPESVDQATFFLGSVAVPSAINNIKAIHTAYPADEPHSVAPLCVAFYPQGTTPTSTTPGGGNGTSTTATTNGGGNGTSTTATTNGGGGGTTATTNGGGGGTTATTGGSGVSDSGATGTTVGAGLEGNTSQTLQQLPLTGIELETAFTAIVALMFGVGLVRRARDWQSRLDRRAARVWRRPLH
ncbi:MAG: hypothetical protein ACR2OI_08775 [Acidimicrobiia bacterium]